MKTLLIPVTLTAFILTACQPLLGEDVPGDITTMPEAVQGRWGLTENDCDPARDDNKGLMVVTDRTLTFYESRGTLTRITEADPTRIAADFDFTGEGQSWTRHMSLDAQDEGRVLIRRDYGDGAMPGPLRYTKCDAA